MLALCETVECRRVQMLNYFGQQGEPCGNCDTCLTPPESWDGTVAAQKVLSTVARLGQRHQKFGAGQIIDILLGKHTAKVEQFGHESLTVFGKGTELGEGEWRGVIRQLMAQGLLSVESQHQTFVLTDESRPVLRGERDVKLRRDPERPAKTRSRSSRAPQVELPPEAATVFERLRAWRGATAKEQGVPAYVIFHDATLREVATQLPASLAELGQISGVGENKLAKYGKGVLAAVAG
jgi:ATP-dependent DNA helicase RecQ